MTLPDAQSAAANADANLARLVQIAAQADADASKSNMALAQAQADAASKGNAQAAAHIALEQGKAAQTAAHVMLAQAVAAVPVDLGPLIFAAKPGDTIAPLAAATEVLNLTIDLKIANLTIDLANVPLTETPSAGASSDIIVHAPNFTAKRWNVVKGGVGFRVYSPFAKFLFSHFDGEISAILTGENGTDMLVSDCELGAKFGAVAVYVVTDRASFIRTKFGGAMAEYDLRWDVDGNGRTPVGALVEDCEFWNTALFGKDTVGFRMIHSMRFNNSRVHGDIRIGQVAKAGFPALTPVDCARDCIIDTCQFDKITRGGAGLRIMEGATVTLLNPEFWGDALTDWISIDAGSELVIKKPILHLPPGVNPKPIVSASATGKWTSDQVTVFNDCTPDRLYVAPAAPATK
jgi:hypothetical protein